MAGVTMPGMRGYHYGPVHTRHPITGSLQPAAKLRLQCLQVEVGSAVQEVVLHIFDHVFYLAFTLGIGFAAKVKAEPLLGNILLEALGKQQTVRRLMASTVVIAERLSPSNCKR